MKLQFLNKQPKKTNMHIFGFLPLISLQKAAAVMLMAACILLTTCNQDPIFFAIMQEREIKDPRIEGSPTNMVIFEREYEYVDESDITHNVMVPSMYVASGSLHWYSADPANPSEKPRWDRIWGKLPQPGGPIYSLATTSDSVTGDSLFALCRASSSSTSVRLKRIKSTGPDSVAWETLSMPDSAEGRAYPNIQSIYASGDRLFICSSSRNMMNGDMSCALFYLDDGGSPPVIKHIKSGIFLIRGAAYDGTNHYFCAVDMIGKDEKGRLYMIPDSDVPNPGGTSLTELKNFVTPTASYNITFYGIISVESPGGIKNIVALDRSGNIYTVNASGYTRSGKNMDTFSGAIAIWHNNIDEPALLLAGYQGVMTYTTSTGYTHGYRELDIKWDGSNSYLDIDNASIHEPGTSGVFGVDATVDNNERYLSTVGKYPINHMFQAPSSIDTEMTLFASTAGKGLWSYRKRNSEWQWNAEE